MKKLTKEELTKIFENSPYEVPAKLEGRDQAINLGISGLMTDGGHHKQWIIEKMLEALGVDLKLLKEVVTTPDEDGDYYDWEEGIAP